jgi:transposase-like protein
MAGVTTTALCRRLGVSASSLCAWIRAGRIVPPARIGRTGPGSRGSARIWSPQDVQSVRAVMMASKKPMKRWRLDSRNAGGPGRAKRISG